MSVLKRTPLHPLYSRYDGARCIDFGGWELPVQFSGILKEHESVRRQAGLFDVSHMGEFLVSGPQAEAFLQRMTTNDVSRLADGQAQYTLMCNPQGGVVDDLLVYRLADGRYMLVVNAANTAKDFRWLEAHAEEGVTVTDISDDTALLALQGPNAAAIISRVTDADIGRLKPFHHLPDATVCSAKALVSRTGYTGEDGFELYVRADEAQTVWLGLMEAGEPSGLVPAGLGARDTLRFEAGLPLYGQELSDTISPLEAGLAYFVKLGKEAFIGRDALQEQQAAGTARKLVGIEMLDRGIPRSHYPVLAGGLTIGEVTSGTQSPTLKRNLGLALIDAAYAQPGTELSVIVRGKPLKAVVVPTPFYRRGKTSPIAAKE